MFALPMCSGWPRARPPPVADQGRAQRVQRSIKSRNSVSPKILSGTANGNKWTHTLQKRVRISPDSLVCPHYLSSRAVTRQVLLAQTSLTSVFGMGTGGPSLQSIRTLMDGFRHLLSSTALQLVNFGDPYRIRTDVNGVRGRCLNHLTNGPYCCGLAAAFGPLSGIRTRDPLIKSQLLYQLS